MNLRVGLIAVALVLMACGKSPEDDAMLAACDEMQTAADKYPNRQFGATTDHSLYASELSLIAADEALAASDSALIAQLAQANSDYSTAEGSTETAAVQQARDAAVEPVYERCYEVEANVGGL
jgi:hypothetical protein